MQFRIKALVSRLASAVYRRVFNQEMSPAVQDFVQSLSWVGAGTVISTGLVAVFSVLGGRLLGPVEYGRFTLVQSIGILLSLPMVMGFTKAMLKYTPERNDLSHQRSIISTVYVIVAGLTAGSIALMLLFAEPLSRLFAATPELFRFAVSFALLYTFFGLAQTTLRSIGRMRAFALSQPAHAVILLVAFALFILTGRLDFESMVYSQLIAFSITGLVVHLLANRQYLRFHFNKAWAHTLTRFSAATLISIIAVTVYGNIAKIIVAHYMTVADVGIYAAYHAATMSIATVLWSVFNMVFFPTASVYKDKRPLLRRIKRLVPFIVVLGTPLVMACGYVVLLLYGREYPISALWLALSSAAAVLFVTSGLYTSLLTSEGTGGAFIGSVAAIVTVGIMLSLSLMLVPASGIAGAIIAAIVAYLAGTAILVWIGGRYLKSHSR